MSLGALDEYLIILVCFELPIQDIISLRKVCRVSAQATRAKILWIHKVEQARQEGQIVPSFMKGRDLLDAVALEGLVRRMARLADKRCDQWCDKWATRDLCSVNVWHLNLPQSITWLRLVNGAWLFVASSDNHSSKISCWDLTLVFQGYLEPLAEAYLPGQVKTGKFEIQASGIVLALGLGSESLSVHLITFRQRSGRHFFSELCRIEGSSHVLMLCGDLVGCAVRGGAIIPHIVNWRDAQIYEISPPPGGLDIPGRRNVPHLMTIWSGTLVIVRTNGLELYSLPSSTGAAMFVKLIPTPTIWEAAVCDPTSVDSAYSPPLRLIVISPLGVEMCVIERELLASWDDGLTCSTICLAKSPERARYDAPWYRLCIGTSSRRCLWMSASEIPVGFMCMPVPMQSSDIEAPSPIAWGKHYNNNDFTQSALWAIPSLDFDDALGFTVLGNCFGEITVFDHDGRHPELCGALGIDFTDQGSPIPPLLPATPIFLGLSVVPRPATTYQHVDDSIISQWSQDDLVLNESWQTDWSDGYGELDLWQGAPNDFVWRLEHAYGFPGPATPQAFTTDPDLHIQRVLVRSGPRYFVFTSRSEPNLRSWPLMITPPPTSFVYNDGQPEPFARATAITEGTIYRGMLSSEIQKGRNRWKEQADRGGRPHLNLLIGYY